MTTIDAINARLAHLAEQFAAAKRTLAHNGPVSEKDSQVIADFENRHRSLKARLGDELETDVPLADADHASFESELQAWLLDVDRRFNNPSERSQSASVD